MQSAGRFYHLEAPEQMSTILREELALIARTVAVDARLEISAIVAAPSSPERNRLIQQAERVGKSRDAAKKATTPEAARKGALEGYGYAFDDAGYGAPAPAPPPPPPR